jgi:hypothetical protein
MKKILFLITSIFLISCEEPYTPVIDVRDNSPIAIIDAFIDISGNSIVHLSHSVPLTSDTSAIPITKADFLLESDQGLALEFSTQSSTGEHVLPHGALSPTAKYRLTVQTNLGTFESEWIEAHTTSDIKDVKLVRTDLGMEVHVSSEENPDKSRFYRWQIEETWRFNSYFISRFIYKEGFVFRRMDDENISHCYAQNFASDIAIATTENLEKNQITDQVIQFVPNMSNKLGIRYSVLVKQYSISKASFVFWNTLKKNSESVGDLFGSMPSELQGNFTSKGNMPVLGWVDAGLPAKKRVYFSAVNFDPPWVFETPFYKGCTSDIILIPDAPTLFGYNPQLVPMDELYLFENNGEPTHYSYTTKVCATCTNLGTTTTPIFWNEND